MFDVVLYQPEIPPNTGNVIRLCANTGARLHLIEPLGFRMGDKEVRRAGLDYHEMANVTVHPDLDRCFAILGERRVYALSSKAGANVYAARFQPADVLLFGPETRGLPADVLERIPRERRLRLPMLAGNRSLNLSNAVAVTVYEAWRQAGFSGAAID
ncbi:MAG: tRNA (cytidine(34)-2'-O)-methyltransferase [Betaproteobacteria bacterium]|nr:tRNA (cytidine(34)-2'-O)-methyltransferase [Betaproteobacteria bacterium]